MKVNRAQQFPVNRQARVAMRNFNVLNFAPKHNVAVVCGIKTDSVISRVDRMVRAVTLKASAIMVSARTSAAARRRGRLTKNAMMWCVVQVNIFGFSIYTLKM